MYCVTCGAANTSDKTSCFACGRDLSEVEQDDLQAAFSGPLLHERYRVLSTVGQGGFAQVYRAEDTIEQNIVAIKAIHLKALSAQEIIDATDTYNREIHFGTTLNHPALPKIFDSFTDQHTWYIVAEFIDGQTLEEYTRQLPTPGVPVHEVLSIGIAVCAALSYLHSRQPPVIFRDLKPDNIMRTTTGRVYLIDFGIARQLRPGARRDTQTLGSPGYAAPEQYGRTQTTERSDIYSLGATLRALLTGKNPLDAQDDDLKRVTAISPQFAALLDQMLAPDQAQRPENIGIVQQELEHARDMIGVSQWRALQPAISLPHPNARNTPRPYRKAKKVPGLTWMSTLLVAVALLALGGVFNATTNFLSSSLHVFSGDNTLAANIQKPPIRATRQTLTLPGSSSDTTAAQLDPVAGSYSQAIQASQALYSGLVQLDDTMHVSPQLAYSWQESDDRRSWTFKLRPSLKFSDGSPLTSQDVVFSLDRALDPMLASPTAAFYLDKLQDANLRINGKLPTLIGRSILAPDPTTVILKTASPTAFLPSALTCTCAFVLEKSLVNKYGTRFVEHLDQGGASGPFKFAGLTAHQTLNFVPNPYYYGSKPQLQKLSFIPFDDSEATYKAYINNQIAFTDVPPARLDQVRNANDFHEALQLQITYYAMNYLVKPFDNIKIRQAFALALDKQLIADVVYKKSVIATNHIIPTGLDAFNPLLLGPDGEGSLHGNLASARWLLQTGLHEEGMSSSGQLPPITFSYKDTPQVRDEAVAVQAMWKNALGITVQLQPLPVVELIKQEMASVNNPHGLQFWRASWSADYPDPQDWTTLQFGQNSPNNTVNYAQNKSRAASKQQEVQLLLQDADEQFNNGDTRIHAYRYAEQQLVNDVAWLPLYQTKDDYLLNPNVQGYVMNAMRVIPADDWANIYITQ